MILIYLIVGAIIGAIAGVLAVRNNQAKVDKLLADTQTVLEDDKAKAKKIMDALKGR